MSDARAATDAGYGIRLIQCHHCDFGSGQRGMDRCSKCDGTGQQWARGGSRFVGTASGFFALLDYWDLAIVPKEPTRAMHDASDEILSGPSWTGVIPPDCRFDDYVRKLEWAAMLAAAPRP